MLSKNSSHLKLAKLVTKQLKKLDIIDAIVIGGSLTREAIDKHSDLDLYIFSDEAVPLNFRKEVVNLLGFSKADLGLTFWDEGDEWIHAESGIEVDLIFWNKKWINQQLSNVLDNYHASVGYSTSFWHTIQNSIILFDRSGWFEMFQSRYNVSYPQELKSAIISKNYPILKDIIPSYYNQIRKAIERNDLVSINHRVAVFMASYFDIIFALNEIPNPGEKNTVRFILENCPKIPDSMRMNIDNILTSTSNTGKLLGNINKLIENLNQLFHELNIILPK